MRRPCLLCPASRGGQLFARIEPELITSEVEDGFENSPALRNLFAKVQQDIPDQDRLTAQSCCVRLSRRWEVLWLDCTISRGSSLNLGSSPFL